MYVKAIRIHCFPPHVYGQRQIVPSEITQTDILGHGCRVIRGLPEIDVLAAKGNGHMFQNQIKRFYLFLTASSDFHSLLQTVHCGRFLFISKLLHVLPNAQFWHGINVLPIRKSLAYVNTEVLVILFKYLRCR